MTKKNILFTIILLTVFSCTSILALFTAKKITTTTHKHSTNSPDFFMTDTTYTKFSRKGDIQNRVKSNKITHFIKNNVYIFEKPNIVIFTPNEKPWYITANEGKSEKEKSKIDLWGKVKIVRAAGVNNPSFDIATTKLTVYPDIKFAKTKQPITIIQNYNINKAVGAEVDFETGIVKLVSNVEGIYQIE